MAQPYKAIRPRSNLRGTEHQQADQDGLDGTEEGERAAGADVLSGGRRAVAS
jgi:hypothetical protein